MKTDHYAIICLWLPCDFVECSLVEVSIVPLFPFSLFCTLVSHAKVQTTSRSPTNLRAFRKPWCPEYFFILNWFLAFPNYIPNFWDQFKNGATCFFKDSRRGAFQGIIRLWRMNDLFFSKQDLDRVVRTQIKLAWGGNKSPSVFNLQHLAPIQSLLNFQKK